VKITLPQRIFDTLYASRRDNVFSNVFVTYGYGLDVNVKAQTYLLRPGSVFRIRYMQDVMTTFLLRTCKVLMLT
jgi:hypothetical protein